MIYSLVQKTHNDPVTVQIRDVVNGYLGQKILVFSETTLNGSVNTSTDGSTATKFTFANVYIQSNVEYCFVVMANSQNTMDLCSKNR